MTEEAAAAKKLFDRERWSEAALALYRVVDGETGDDPGNKQLAQYYLAICALPAEVLPGELRALQPDRRQQEPPQVQGDAALAGQARDAAAGARRHHRARRQVHATIRSRASTTRSSGTCTGSSTTCSAATSTATVSTKRPFGCSRRWTGAASTTCKSQFFTGISYVQVRKSVPAVQSFQRIEKALDEGVEGVEDEDRMRDLAYLSMARTYYSASIKLDAETQHSERRREEAQRRGQVLEPGRRRRASTGSTRCSRSPGRTSWPATTRTRSATSTPSQSPYFPNSFYPEADILKAVIYFANCNYEGGHDRGRSLQQEVRADPRRAGEGAQALQGREPGRAVLQVPEGGPRGQGEPRRRGSSRIVENALSDRQLLRNIEYVRLLDDEVGALPQVAARLPRLGRRQAGARTRSRSRATSRCGRPASSRCRATSATWTS